MTFEHNEHYATMKRSTRETCIFAACALIATVATTMLAVAPARAAGGEAACAEVATTASAAVPG
jgi:hypothetical protein